MRSLALPLLRVPTRTPLGRSLTAWIPGDASGQPAQGLSNAHGGAHWNTHRPVGARTGSAQRETRRPIERGQRTPACYPASRPGALPTAVSAELLPTSCNMIRTSRWSWSTFVGPGAPSAISRLMWGTIPPSAPPLQLLLLLVEGDSTHVLLIYPALHSRVKSKRSMPPNSVPPEQNHCQLRVALPRSPLVVLFPISDSERPRPTEWLTSNCEARREDSLMPSFATFASSSL
jgi:hypothetical protein